MSSDSVAQAELRSYIRRILNVLAEIDELGDDKKSIYKEAADNGFDRTVLSQVVGHLRKKAKAPEKFEERSALFDLYLGAYEGTGTEDATRGHAAREAKSGQAETLQEASSEPGADEGSQQIQQSPADVPEGEVSRTSGAEIQADGNARQPAQTVPALPVVTAPAESAAVEISAPLPPATDKPAESVKPSAAPSEPRVNPNCLKHQRGEQCWMSHKAYSCSECNAAAAKAKAATKAGKAA